MKKLENHLITFSLPKSNFKSFDLSAMLFLDIELKIKLILSMISCGGAWTDDSPSPRIWVTFDWVLVGLSSFVLVDLSDELKLVGLVFEAWLLMLFMLFKVFMLFMVG